jgi:hypothetical protein
LEEGKRTGEEELEKETSKSRTEIGRNGERATVTWLRRHGVKCKRVADYNSRFDVLTDSGLKIEVKTASLGSRRGRDCWRANFHRHGKLKESGVDFYILVLDENDLFSCRIFVVIPAPIGSSTICITARTLVNRFAANINNWSLIAEAV